jgi:hypothetical protein
MAVKDFLAQWKAATQPDTMTSSENSSKNDITLEKDTREGSSVPFLTM